MGWRGLRRKGDARSILGRIRARFEALEGEVASLKQRVDGLEKELRERPQRP
jgi:hypothetical protein